MRWFAFACACSCGIVVASPRPVFAQAGGAGAAAAPPSPSATTEPAPAPAPAAPPPDGTPSADSRAAALPTLPTINGPAEEPQARRLKPLRMTIGLLPTASDLGSEADLVSTADNDAQYAESLKKWTFSLKGYLRAPLRIGWGPSCGTSQMYSIRFCNPNEKPHTELHSPPRMVGFSSGDWTYIGLAPNTSGSLRVTVANPLVSANVIFSSSNFNDVGFMDLDQIGGISQAYVTLKFPSAFGSWGGLAWTVGAFSNRYGNAGPNQTSSGYYSANLFGRTHVVGEDLTADIDLSDDLELVLEHGVGAKLDVTPFIGPEAPQPSYFSGQGRPGFPHGSNYLHHIHAALMVNRWMQFGTHYMTSWTPNDKVPVSPIRSGEGRLTVYGADVHLDDDELGHFYFGYSHVDAKNLLPLDEALQLLHGGDGYNFKLEYFGQKNRLMYGPGANSYPYNDSGTVDTLLWQYILRLAPLLGEALPIHDVALAFYGMYNHANAYANTAPAFLAAPFTNDRVKFGVEAELALLKYLSLGFRYDRVIPDLKDTSDAYTALSPRAILHSTWKSKEYIIVDYTHFLLGPNVYPSSPYSSMTNIDPDMLMVSAIMSF